ncbi:MAG TPA: branched-chain amino acid ABC transporter permease, partial [Nitriliruptorales bacterium]|nr:branched-chain amino acid ABC transporter permease [Nitriliruptorales bacterium]
PALVGVLTFHMSLATGIAVLMAVTVAVATVGAAVHLIPQRWRGPVLTAVLWVLTVGLLRELIAQIFRGIKLGSVNQVLFARGGGLSLRGGVVVGVAVFALAAYLEPREGTLRRRVEALSPGERQRWAAVAIAAVIAVVAVTPMILGTFMSEILDLVGIFLLMALGLNIVVGYAGLLDLGYVAFFAVGAYSTAVLTSPASPTLSPELIFWAALPFVVLAAAFSGVLVGTPVLRMRGDYLAIVTLGFGEIARILFLSDWFKPMFGGAQGITRIPGITIGAAELNTPPEFFYPIAGLVLLTAYLSWALYHSRTGRAWIAMREDEPVAEALGINIVTAKLSAFIIGATLASFGGAVFASKIGAIFPNSFSIVVSIIVLVIIIVGGMGSLPGVAVGALVIQGIPQLLREFEAYQFLLYGALLIYMMLAKPEGLVPSKRRAQELHQDELMQDAWFSREEEQLRRETPAPTPERAPDAGLT